MVNRQGSWVDTLGRLNRYRGQGVQRWWDQQKGGKGGKGGGHGSATGGQGVA